MTDDELEILRADEGIIRNRLKIYSARKNAIVFIKIQEEFGSFDNYLWAFVNYQPIVNHHDTYKTIPVRTEISDRLSADLKKRGMSFVGSTIIYAYMQAVGLVDDHLSSCHIRLNKRI
jgi:DNA-3-methyladenine glycosylase I